jgi:hypothetical protein
MLKPQLTHTRAALLSLAWLAAAGAALAADYPDVPNGPSFTGGGELRLPQGFRHWVFIGAPLTPNGLNGGAAGFPEFHNVYVQPAAYAYYQANGSWPEGTMMVKELQLVIPGTFADGSRVEASGRGYFPGTPNGLDVSVKDSRRFAATNGWGFFNFGHHAPPYIASTPLADKASCAGCHMASAHEDMVFVDFYRQLTPLPGDRMSGMKSREAD